MHPISSKYEQVQRHLRRWIQERKFPVGEKLPSESALCRQLGVGRVTVRRAIAELAKQGLITSRPGFGHVVAASEPAPTVGVLMNYAMFGRTRGQRVFSSFALLTLNAIRLELHQRGWAMRLYLPQPHETEHRLDHTALLEDLDRRRIAGLLTCGWPRPGDKHPSRALASDAQVLDRLQRDEVPLVSVTSRDVPQASTSTDYFALGYVGAEHFLQRNVRRLALLTLGKQPDDSTREGFRQALADHGQQVRSEWVLKVDARDEQHGCEAFTQWWPRLAQRPEALVIDDDQTGKGAMFAAVLMGLRRQRDLRIACQSVRGAEPYTGRPYVRLEVDPAEHARDAVNKLAALLADPRAEPPRTWIQPRVIEPVKHAATAPQSQGVGARPSPWPRRVAPHRTQGRKLEGQERANHET